MWGTYLVALVLFIIGVGLLREEQHAKVDDEDLGRTSKGDHGFAGLVLIVVAVLIAIWV